MFVPLAQRVAIKVDALAFKLPCGGVALGLGPSESDAVFLGLHLRRAASLRLALTMKIDDVAQLIPSREWQVPPKPTGIMDQSCATPRAET